VQTVKTPGDISDGGYNAAIIVPASRRRTGTAGEGGGEAGVDTLGFLSTAAVLGLHRRNADHLYRDRIYLAFYSARLA